MKDEKDEKMSFDLMDYEEYIKEFVKLMALREKIENEQKELASPSKGVIEELEDAKQKNIDIVLSGGEPEIINFQEIYRNNLYNRTQKKIRVYREAEVVQEKRLNHVRLEISRKIAKRTKPEYQKIILDMCTKWCELGELIVKEKNLRESLNDNQISFTGEFTAMPTRLGDPRVYNSRFSNWLLECCKFNYCKFDDIPAEFRDSWKKIS